MANIQVVVPDTASPGDAISIHGSGFGTTPGHVEIRVPSGMNSVNLVVTSWSDTRIEGTVPASDTNTGLGEVVVVTVNQTSVFTVT